MEVEYGRCYSEAKSGWTGADNWSVWLNFRSEGLEKESRGYLRLTVA